MKYNTRIDPSSCGLSLVMPKDCRTPKDLIEGVGGVGKGLLVLTKKELRKLKRKEKENLWRRNNRRNAQPDPVVVHFPKEPPRSALQTVHKESGKARDNHFYQGGLSHDWVSYYDKSVSSDQSCINEWNAMDSLESKRPPSPDSITNKKETEFLIRSKLKEIMMSVDIDEVTSKYIRQRLEEDLALDLFKFKSFIDQEMLTILGQMDAATEIFPHVYLGSEWNASNLDELKNNGVGFILNVTKEIDNFYPGMFDYLNIRVYDDENTELLRHWDDTYRYISQVKEKDSKVLVHCKMGISRSASVVIAYAMKALNISLDEATELVKRKRSCIKPNQAFTSQLKIYQGILDASRQRHNALFRSKSETNLKSSGSCNHYNSKCNYIPRIGNSMRIPDFKPKLSSQPLVSKNCQVEDKSEDNSAADNDFSTLYVPSPTQGRRPKSWSPDEDTTRLISLQPFEDSDFGESLQKSRSLNDQAWQAHVTIQQRDSRDPGGGLTNEEGTREKSLVEAVNPLYASKDTPPSSPSSTQHLEDLQLSSSVKERINEFESAQTVSAKHCSSSSKNTSLCSQTISKISPVTITLENVTTSSTNDYNSLDDYSGNTKDLDDVIESLLLTPSEIENKAPVLSQMKSSPQKHQAYIVPSQICTEEHILCEEVSTPVSEVADCSVVVPNESITWPAGIVKKQKEDFEGKVKSKETTKSLQRGKEQESSIRNLSRQGSSHSLNAIDGILKFQNSVPETAKKDDLFSVRVDKVFDREEKKDKKQTPIGVPFIIDTKDTTPSRNNSWGSFDSAVVLPDRDTPSRQSSWGSCDTRISGGSILSRNSSCGAFDSKQTGLQCIISDVSGQSFTPSILALNSFDKDSVLHRRNKINARESVKNSLNTSEEVNSAEDGNKYINVTNVKAYGPMPFKSPIEKEPVIIELDDRGESNMVHYPSTPTLSGSYVDETFPILTRSQPDITSFSSQNNNQTERREFKSSPQTPEHEIPLPGTVRQQKQKLEIKSQQSCIKKNDLIDKRDNLTIPVPPIGRSFSSGCVCPNDLLDRKNQITRSSSEKRTKSDCEAAKGNVKKITTALENQKTDASHLPSKFSSSLKQRERRVRPNLMPRSLSLERLGVTNSPPTPNKRLSASSFIQSCDSDVVSSQNFLGQLVVETQEQIKQLEKDQEEINVKNLVDKFEEGKPEKKNRIFKSYQNTDCVMPSDKILRPKIRPRSESMGENDLPPVPQRKSSLDYNFRPVQKSPSHQPTVVEGVQQSSSSLSPVGKTFPAISSIVTSDVPKTNITSPPKLPPPTSNRACSTEVRRRKQQGKTHPLSKLASRENTL